MSALQGAARFRTSNIEHRTSNIEHRTSNIEHPTSNIQHPTTNNQQPTSNIQHPTSNIQYSTSNAEGKPAGRRRSQVGNVEQRTSNAEVRTGIETMPELAGGTPALHFRRAQGPAREDARGTSAFHSQLSTPQFSAAPTLTKLKMFPTVSLPDLEFNY
jgi:hypothetical protein